ncbi:MAG: DUF4135 domain-containing protein [Eggerthellaceae bacterium]|nr:DUF4135 domain-containing protein [Eggerthellaceae bacterium]
MLTDTDESGIVPIVDGKSVTVRPYLPSFKEGYQAAYTRVIEQREEIREAVLALPADTAARIVLRSTRGYFMMLQKLNHRTALASQESRLQAVETLAGYLRKFDITLDDAAVESEIAQMRRGDVPYFYTRLDSLSLYAEGEELVPDMFGVTAIGRVLATLDAMGQGDESFDLSYIDGAIRQYPPKDKEREKGSGARRAQWMAAGAPPAAGAPLSSEAAAEAAREVLDTIYALGIETPNGQLVWGTWIRQANRSPWTARASSTAAPG